MAVLSILCGTQALGLVRRGSPLIESDLIFHPIGNAGQFLLEKSHCLEWPMKLNNQNDYSERQSGTKVKEHYRAFHTALVPELKVQY